jgi:hypothetical protein
MKVIRIGDDEYHFIFEEGMTTHKAVLNKADMVVLNSLASACIPFMAGFTEAFKTGVITQSDQDLGSSFPAFDAQSWS